MNNKISVSSNPPLSSIEKIVVVIVFLLMVIGIATAFINKSWFEEKYVVEDGFIEWLTVVPLAIMFIAAISFMMGSARRKKNLWFFTVYILIALGSFFIMGEEISWSQRIFHFKTSQYFEKHNSQDEMNIHNLIVDGVKLNKIIFTQLMIAGVVIYLIIFPLVYKRNQKFKAFIDKAAVPIPRLYQAIGCIAVFILSFLTFNPKGAELLEFGSAAMFMLIVLYPKNSEGITNSGIS